MVKGFDFKTYLSRLDFHCTFERGYVEASRTTIIKAESIRVVCDPLSVKAFAISSPNGPRISTGSMAKNTTSFDQKRLIN